MRWFITFLSFFFTSFTGILFWGSDRMISVYGTSFMIIGVWFLVMNRYEPEILVLRRDEKIMTVTFILFSWWFAFVLPDVLGLIVLWPITLTIEFTPEIPIISHLFYFGIIQIAVIYVVLMGRVTTRILPDLD